jgi:putative transposase
LAELNLTAIAEKWDESHPTISPSWCCNWERIIPFFAYPAEIRKVIYTTNVIESGPVNLSV